MNNTEVETANVIRPIDLDTDELFALLLFRTVSPECQNLLLHLAKVLKQSQEECDVSPQKEI